MKFYIKINKILNLLLKFRLNSNKIVIFLKVVNYFIKDIVNECLIEKEHSCIKNLDSK